ncbi:uncharacterized protein LOC134285164 [Aedes albopictus]|uniref:Secreted protein n=1 Tax=Aedes albopictus TaxID=7160 RepID=A0ABM1ZZN8_AEDAL
MNVGGRRFLAAAAVPTVFQPSFNEPYATVPVDEHSPQSHEMQEIAQSITVNTETDFLGAHSRVAQNCVTEHKPADCEQQFPDCIDRPTSYMANPMIVEDIQLTYASQDNITDEAHQGVNWISYFPDSAERNCYTNYPSTNHNSKMKNEFFGDHLHPDSINYVYEYAQKDCRTRG